MLDALQESLTMPSWERFGFLGVKMVSTNVPATPALRVPVVVPGRVTVESVWSNLSR